MHIIPRDLRDQCKYGQISGVEQAVMRVDKAFNQKKYKDRECNSADVAAYGVYRIRFTGKRKQFAAAERYVTQDVSRIMIDEHHDDCDQLQRTSA